ncbi:hypothetical protein LCI18_011772 [Fusarium solani-melongenae]|uniref:Uncharacterized protein n=1 Tax=Fusarium solani subsp. cucurbitae TaxID=2747967 RepID=A0ACD3ZIC8_FUSSC|nr:hypothetical protein LCI18_011772 [Fusarium solani-melongenae]
MDFTNFFNVIDGKLESTVETRHGLNPSTLEENPPVPVSTQDDVDRAVAAARVAAEAWSAIPYKQRQQAVAAFADGLEAVKDEFAVLLTKEQGKPLEVANFEVAGSIQFLRGYARLPELDEVIEDEPGRRIIARYTPLGVAVGIVPWNSISKLGPAIIAGNAIVLKPSYTDCSHRPFTPYCNLKLAELGLQYFPPGLLQALSGDDNLGPMLTEHSGVDKVSFTGSTETGKRVMRSCASTLKRVTLELGGNDPAIVYPDVDIKAVAPQLVRSALLNSGQVCIAVKRIYIHESIYDELLRELVAEVAQLRVADGLEDGAKLGPVQNQLQFDRVMDLLADIKSQKLKLATGPINPVMAGKGYFVTPTVVDNPPDSSRIVVEEPFGPVFPVLKWKDEEEVFRRANDTAMGLGASIWTSDIEKGEKLAKKLNAGTVWINSHLQLLPNTPFGGHKQSGIGVEHGVEGIKSYCNIQAIHVTAA